MCDNSVSNCGHGLPIVIFFVGSAVSAPSDMKKEVISDVLHLRRNPFLLPSATAASTSHL